MRISLVVPFLTALFLVGCAHKEKAVFQPLPGMATPAPSEPVKAKPQAAKPVATAPVAAKAPAEKPIVTPASGLAGKVVRYTPDTRIGVLEFPVGRLPALEQRMFVYRDNLKVGEIKVTGPQQDVYIVGDLTNGEVRVGDEVRDK